ncbi:CDP-alcohol phosphatidyltransferase-domain-containing protein [Parachaetomium inaequale]|uniref:CDP-alcohol phosphatidyltransferase-domain-containing protein n=1 Tax=Parachaetomium inaequale TaxID=2588326 RepID=A0AAN6PNM5_9PEZI|nr:CDP-alcohol phosphatidyltransferase-domain-containing protein [Parachaetomium inaequale]
MTALCFLTPASAGLRHGASVGFGKTGLLGSAARGGRGGLNVGGVRGLGAGRRWHQNVLPRLAGYSRREHGLGPAGVEVHAQARWFVASSRWRRGGQKGAESEKGSTGLETDSSPPPKQEPTSALRKILPAISKTNLRENIYTIPNILTASRLIAAPFIGYCILHDYHATALGLFAYAGITDALDGWIARRWNLGTVVGTVIDPMADKTLMTVLTVALAMKGALPVWLAVIILGRDVGLAISAIYYRWISLPPPKTFARYWDFSLPSAEVHPTTISKYNTALQLGLMGLTTLAPVIPAVDMSTPLGIMQYVVATTTIWSGASYIYSKDAVKILTPQEAEEKKAEKKKQDSR